MTYTWDPDRYLTYADERGRPFVELIARIDEAAPRRIVDLGCGPGNLTRLLADRWPDAQVEGVDASPEMIEKARVGAGRVSYRVGEVESWRADEPVDVLVSNATLQWVPGHLQLLPRLLDQVRAGGWFAVQVPGNFEKPSHVIREQLSAEAPYEALTRGIARPEAPDATSYWQVLSDLGCEVDAWETTYLHVLSGPDPVYTWISGTSLRPTLAALDAEPDLRAAYEDELRSRLRAAYPERDGRVLMPFRRVFVVARKA